MQLTNSGWSLIGTAGRAYQTVQNTGETTIIVAEAAALPADDALMNKGEHFVLRPETIPLTFGSLDTNGMNLYGRSFGPKDGFITSTEPAA